MKQPDILFINGPNLNLLGKREPQIYGSGSYKDLCAFIDGFCGGAPHRIFQSNSEGDIIDEIQAAPGRADGIVINPAAYTHTSIAIADALRAVGIPYVEVHLTDPFSREPDRRISDVSDRALAVVTGLGFEGYRKAYGILTDSLAKGAARPADTAESSELEDRK